MIINKVRSQSVSGGHITSNNVSSTADILLIVNIAFSEVLLRYSRACGACVARTLRYEFSLTVHVTNDAVGIPLVKVDALAWHADRNECQEIRRYGKLKLKRAWQSQNMSTQWPYSTPSSRGRWCTFEGQPVALVGGVIRGKPVVRDQESSCRVLL
jgi:hypothetical protein